MRPNPGAIKANPYANDPFPGLITPYFRTEFLCLGGHPDTVGHADLIGAFLWEAGYKKGFR